MIIWTPAEAKRFLLTAKEHRLFAAFYLVMATGMRRGEVLGLRWQDVKDNIIHIQQVLVLLYNKPVIATPKTERGTRLVAISPDVIEVLNAHRSRQQAEGAYNQETDLVFTSEVGTPLNPRNFERTWYLLRDKAEVSKIRFHALRHMHVSLLVKHGLDPRTIAERVGHTDPTFTMRTYSKLFEEQRLASAVSLDELLGSP